MNWLLWVGIYLTVIGWMLAALRLATRADRMTAEHWAEHLAAIETASLTGEADDEPQNVEWTFGS